MQSSFLELHAFTDTSYRSFCNIKFNYIIGLGKKFEGSNLRSFTAHSKLSFSLEALLPRPLQCLQQAHLCNNRNVWLILWTCPRKFVDAMLAVSVLFFNPAMLNPSRNKNNKNIFNKNEGRYRDVKTLKACKQGWEVNVGPKIKQTTSI